jgi:gamma-glutamyltranspeptidase
MNLSLYFLVLFAMLLELTPKAITASQSRQSSGGKMSPEAWPPGEMEKYWQLQRDYQRPHPAVESDKGMVAVTHDARIKPGDRLPDTTNPVIVLKNDKPYLASSSIGSALHQYTMSNLFNVLEFGMDLKKSIDTPNFMGPYFGSPFGGGPPVPQMYMEVLAEGEFDENLVKAVVAKGQAIKLLPKPQTAGNGYWVAIQIDPKTGKRVGVAPPLINGDVAGY